MRVVRADDEVSDVLSASAPPANAQLQPVSGETETPSQSAPTIASASVRP